MEPMGVVEYMRCLVWAAVVTIVIRSVVSSMIKNLQADNFMEINVLMSVICEDRRELFLMKIAGMDVCEETVTALDRLHRDAYALYERNVPGNLRLVRKDVRNFHARLIGIETSCMKHRRANATLAGPRETLHAR